MQERIYDCWRQKLKGKKGRIIEKGKMCNGVARIYTSFLIVVRVYIQNVEFLALEWEKWGICVCRGKGKAMEERFTECGEKCYKRCPLMCEVTGAIAMVKIHQNSQKWSSEDPAGRASLQWEFYNSYWLSTHGYQYRLHCRSMWIYNKQLFMAMNRQYKVGIFHS